MKTKSGSENNSVDISLQLNVFALNKPGKEVSNVERGVRNKENKEKIIKKERSIVT